MRVAVVGTGSIGRRHLTNLRHIGVEDLIAVSMHNRHSMIEIEGTFFPVLHDFRAALAIADAVVIANPTSLHHDYLRDAVAAGRHVYVEKPASHSSAGLDAIDRQARDRNLVVCVGSQFRFNPALERIKAMLDAERIGRLLTVVAASGENIADYHPNEDYRTGYAARAELGGGVLLTQIHQIDYLNWLFGGFRSAFALPTETPELGINVESCVSYMLSGKSSPPVIGHLNYLQRPKHTMMEIIGSEGRISWSYEDNSVVLVRCEANESSNWSAPFNRDIMFHGILRDFLEAIAGRSALRSPLADGISAIRIVEAIKASTESGRPESVD